MDKIIYRGTAFSKPPAVDFLFPESGLLMAGETIGVSVLQSALFRNALAGTANGGPENNWDKLANGFTPMDRPDGRSGDPNNLNADTTLPGQPVYGRIILGDPNGNNTWTDAQGVAGSYFTVELDCAICSIGFNNQVVRTNIQGLPYSIKEFISSGDNDITITGIFCSTPGVAPITFIQNLNNIFSAPVAIPVTNYFLNNNNIYHIVCMPGCEMPQEEGGYAYQKFTIKAVTDTPPDQMLP